MSLAHQILRRAACRWPEQAKISASWLRSSAANPESLAYYDEVAELLGPPAGLCYELLDAVTECSSLVEEPDGEVLLPGDSTALQLFSGMSAAASSLELNMTLAYENACPSNAVNAQIPNYDECHGMWDNVYDQVEVMNPDVVVVALAVDHYPAAQKVILLDDYGERVVDLSERAELVNAGALETLERLDSLVEEVRFVRVTPKFNNWFPAHCSYAMWAIDANGCGRAASWSEVNEQRAAALALEDHLLQTTSVEMIVLDDELCEADGCATSRDGTWMYRDGSHITTKQSERLAPLLSRALGDAVGR